jgi:hypothetical protein
MGLNYCFRHLRRHRLMRIGWLGGGVDVSFSSENEREGRVWDGLGSFGGVSVIKMVYKKTQPCGWVFEICFGYLNLES